MTSKFNNICAQGDVLFIKIDKIPDNAKKVLSETDKLIITHSETGHHHSMVLDRERENVEFYSGDNPLISWIKVNRPTSLDHEKSFDTHESIMFEPGIYEIRRQREYTPEGFRAVQD